LETQGHLSKGVWFSERSDQVIKKIQIVAMTLR